MGKIPMDFMLVTFLFLTLVMASTVVLFIPHVVFFTIFMHFSITHFLEFLEFGGGTMMIGNLFWFVLIVELELNFGLWVGIFHLPEY